MLNVIKFIVCVEGKRNVEVIVGVSYEWFVSFFLNVVFFDFDEWVYCMDVINIKEWGIGDIMYVFVVVKDIGIGISEEG